MSLSGSGLQTSLQAAHLAALQAQFPISGALTSAEQALLASYQTKLATAIATGDGPTTVTHITTNAVVHTTDTGTVTSGAGAGGAVSATGTGTVA